MSFAYQRPALGLHRREIEILNSRFITSISRATNPDEARQFIGQIRKEMSDASHHVYAFRTGYSNSITDGMSNDGEPSGTAGPPTLAVLRGFDIGDVVLVTSRYFGGTKLGTGGLVRAYSEAARNALESLSIVIKSPKVQLGIEIPYSLYEQVKRSIEAHQGLIVDESFAAQIMLIANFLESHEKAFAAELIELSAGQVESILLDKFED
jgi:uncharacterized YigZ family protein